MEPGSTPRPLAQKKKTWRDSLPIDMLLSAVSVMVVAQSSSEIPEGLMNNPVHVHLLVQIINHKTIKTPGKYVKTKVQQLVHNSSTVHPILMDMHLRPIPIIILKSMLILHSKTKNLPCRLAQSTTPSSTVYHAV